MRIILLTILLAAHTTSNSSVIDFDNITNANYERLYRHQDLYWTNSELVSNSAFQNDYGNTYGSTSGQYSLGNWVSAPITVSGSLFNFTGVNLSSWSSNNSFDQYSATELTITAFNGSSIIGAVTTNLSSNQYNWLSVNFNNITSVEFAATETNKWWVMDDFTYETVVPVPSALWLFISGFLCLINLARNNEA